ncbi:hypothetical protein [Ruegeria profundi]|uniref:hypothetical protein n=1 Tax=Ruegeria profundi TaxID=1685378 RepID=UPI001CD26C8D|nr:hypothetical protein [Ruegeria profundi]MCA0928849.1 hypothetical protein [Ruegeria profundi]
MRIGLGRHVSGDDLGLDAAAAQIEGCGDVCEIRVQVVSNDPEGFVRGTWLEAGRGLA